MRLLVGRWEETVSRLVISRLWVLAPRTQAIDVSHGTVCLGGVFGIVTRDTLEPDGVDPVVGAERAVSGCTQLQVEK